MTESAVFSTKHCRAAVVQELRRLLPGSEGLRNALPFGLAALDSCLPKGGLAAAALHEVVPQTQTELPAAFGFMVACLSRLPQTHPLIFVTPGYEQREYGRLYGHGLNGLGLDPHRLIVVETAHRKETLWAMAEALRSAAPQAVAGMIDRLDLKTSQKLHLAAMDCRPAAFPAAAGANAGSKCSGNALARRHGGSRARPLRFVGAPAMASAP